MYFRHDPRLHISLPDLPVPFEELTVEEQEEVLVQWSRIRAQIPDKIKEFENKINALLEVIYEEDDWDKVIEYFDEITEYASCINDLNLWSRVDPDIHPKPM